MCTVIQDSAPTAVVRATASDCRHTTGPIGPRLRWHLPVWVGRRNGRSHLRDHLAVGRTSGVCSCAGQVGGSVLAVCLPAICHVSVMCRVGSCAGEYTLTGVWMSETQTWTLTPGAWLTNPCNYFMIGFSGTIDVVAGLRRFSGSVTFSGCTTFSLMEMDRTTGTPSPLFAHHL